MNSWSLVHLLCSIEFWRLWLSIDLLWGLAQTIKTCRPPSKYFSQCSFLSVSGSGNKYLPILVMAPNFWTVISSLLVPAELGHGTSTSGWICFSNLYMSLMCYLLYDVVIVRARSSRMEGSRRLVVVLLIVFSFSLCLLIGLVESAALPASSLDRLRYLLIRRNDNA